MLPLNHVTVVKWKRTSMAKDNMITMEGRTALAFASIHPTQNGMFFYRVKAMEAWLKFHNTLCASSSAHDGAYIGELSSSCSSIGDAIGWINELIARILDGQRPLALQVDGQRFVITRKTHEGSQQLAFNVHYYIQNGHNWICQWAEGWWFKDNAIGLLDVLYGQMLSDHWSNIKHNNPSLIQEES